MDRHKPLRKKTYSKRKNFFASHLVKHGGSQFEGNAGKAAREGLGKQNQYRKRNIEVLHPKALTEVARTPRGVQLRVHWLIFADLLVLIFGRVLTEETVDVRLN